MIDRLIQIIGREASLFESFLALFEEQQRMLVSNDADGLVEITAQLREKLLESRKLNQQREEMVHQIKRENLIEGDLSVTRLLKIVDDTQATQLVQLRDLITTLNDKIMKTRNQNAMLLNESREYISKMMGMLSKNDRKRFTYSEGLRKICRMVLGILDTANIYKTDEADRDVEIIFPSPLPENTMEKLKEAHVKKELGVPNEQVLRELGYEKS